jgi:hypothetical protein
VQLMGPDGSLRAKWHAPLLHAVVFAQDPQTAPPPPTPTQGAPAHTPLWQAQPLPPGILESLGAVPTESTGPQPLHRDWWTALQQDTGCDTLWGPGWHHWTPCYSHCIPASTDPLTLHPPKSEAPLVVDLNSFRPGWWTTVLRICSRHRAGAVLVVRGVLPPNHPGLETGGFTRSWTFPPKSCIAASREAWAGGAAKGTQDKFDRVQTSDRVEVWVSAGNRGQARTLPTLSPERWTLAEPPARFLHMKPTSPLLRHWHAHEQGGGYLSWATTHVMGATDGSANTTTEGMGAGVVFALPDATSAGGQDTLLPVGNR